MTLKEFRYYLRWHLKNDVVNGGRYFLPIYNKLSKIYNPVKPFYWHRNKPPNINLPDDYDRIIPCAYNTGDGWLLHWGIVHKDDCYPESIVDIMDDIKEDDTYIFEWPTILPCSLSSNDLERIGFYVI